MEYIIKQYSSVDELKNGAFYELYSYHWEAETPYRPKTYANVGIVDGDLVAVLKCFEENPRTACTQRDSAIYTDSCLEFFVASVEGRKEYVNVECNSKGVFLSEFGVGKFNRVLVSSVTNLSPEVTPFEGETDNKPFWGVTIKLTKDFVADLYKISREAVSFNKIKLNFYKCGDECEIPHYLAFSPVTTLPPGFHNPDCFVEFKKEI